ncbi:ATP-binding cassette domain-containing protein [bacterium]|nr:ATP-binding cassette domain-containing protein [bacterium]
MLILEKITKKIGARVLFENVSVSFNSRQRYGLTGPNGAGKSTLMKIMMGIDDPTSGNVTLPKKVGFLKQDLSEFEECLIRDVVIMGNNRLWKTRVEQDKLYESEIDDKAGMRLAELEEIVAEEDGYTAESDAEVLLEGMGIIPEFYEAPMKALPVDMQFRVLLCQALFGNPEALLLDEPTNHLDLEAIRWLETFLKGFDGTLIVISHDRHFLNSVCTSIADIDYETIVIYPGNYDDMVVAKSDVRLRVDQENKNKEKKAAQLKEFVAKFGAGTRASQVQSRLKELEKLQPQELKKSNIMRPYICFQNPERNSGQIPYKLKKVSKSYDDNHVIKNFSYEVNRGDKIGIIGNNGMGKTTLLKLIAGVEKPTEGEILLGHQTLFGYFPQLHEEVMDKGPNPTILDFLRTQKEGVHEQEIRSALGKLLFPGDDAFKGVAKLSGGETARVILAGLILNTHNTLILDEPNNHLDLESVSALSTGLANFPGTVIFASHDRDLIDKVATRIISIEKDGIHKFDGPLEEYLKSREQTV